MKNLNKLYLALCAAIALSFAACTTDGKITRSDSYEATIYPDYKDITIPCNIAPMNFSVMDSSATNYALSIEVNGKTLWVNADEKDFSVSPSDWQDLISASSVNSLQSTVNSQPSKITFTIAREINGEWVGGKPVSMTVVPDSIDDYITYRLVPPGYVGWYRMGIYQHQLSTSKEEVIFENSHTLGNCVNCHTPSSRNSNQTIMHMRTSFGGTYLCNNGTIERLEAKTDSTIGAFVYPSWHPNGKLIAFSNNNTAQTFHTTDKDRIEVFDAASDIIVYDIEKREVFSTPLLKDSLRWETFPHFSPDGKWLYYCTAPRVHEIELNYKQAKYSLCRIAFDAEKQTFGNEVDTIFSSSKGIVDADGNTILQGKSISFPRISPDGKYLVCTIHNYGNFSIWHKDADLYMIDLSNPKGFVDMKAVNSDQTESYHTWSSNSHWLVFSARRDDGLYTRPYFTYIDNHGKAHKPFMLPQENPRKHYAQCDYSYNIPEFMTTRFSTPMRDIINATQQDSIKVKYRSASKE